MTSPADRERLRRLIPSASGRLFDPPVALAEFSADSLVDLVLDETEPWWRRQVCVRALAGRVPAARAIALLDLTCDSGVTTEIRVALLDVLSTTDGQHAGDLLRWLRAQERFLGSVDSPYGLDQAILLARGRMGDLSAAGPLATLAADPWSRRRRVGEQAVDALIGTCGLPDILAALHVDSPQDLAANGGSPARRLLGLRLAHRSGEDITPSLADESTMVARKAYELLAETDGPEDVLVDMVDGRRPGHLWALAVLHRRGHPIRDRWDSLGPPVIDLPGVPPDVRAAIVRTYTPGERDTDPRWLLEAACLEEPDQPGTSGSSDVFAERAAVARAHDALTAAGLHPREPVPVGEDMEQGEGTYDIIRTDVGDISVSTLGPFFRPARSADPRLAAVVRESGLRHIEPELAQIRFDGLAVYYFGAREPLTVGELLFYWQD